METREEGLSGRDWRDQGGGSEDGPRGVLEECLFKLERDAMML